MATVNTNTKAHDALGTRLTSRRSRADGGSRPGGRGCGRDRSSASVPWSDT